jgi:hypothetical protein
MSLFMNFSAIQPAKPPMMMAAIHDARAFHGYTSFRGNE